MDDLLEVTDLVVQASGRHGPVRRPGPGSGRPLDRCVP